MATPNIFPFYLRKSAADSIFNAWYKENRAMLNRDYGSIGFVGTSHATPEICEREGTIYISPGHRKSWSHYEHDVIALSADEVEIRTYGMASMTYGGRGELKNTFTAKVKPEQLAVEIKRIQLEHAEDEYERRLELAAQELRKREINKVYAELFGEAA